jgi:transposase
MRDGINSAERAHIQEREREVKELRKANEILKLASAFFPKQSTTTDSSAEKFS